MYHIFQFCWNQFIIYWDHFKIPNLSGASLLSLLSHRCWYIHHFFCLFLVSACLHCWKPGSKFPFTDASYGNFPLGSTLFLILSSVKSKSNPINTLSMECKLQPSTGNLICMVLLFIQSRLYQWSISLLKARASVWRFFYISCLPVSFLMMWNGLWSVHTSARSS